MPSREFNRAKLFDAMAEAGVDAVVASSPWNVTYTAGVYLDIPQPTFLVTTRDGRQALIVNEADAYLMRSNSSVGDVRDYRIGESMAADADEAARMLRDVLTEMGLKSGRIGIEEDILSGRAERRLGELLPEAKLRPATRCFEEARMFKLPWEVEAFRKAAYYTDKAIMTGFAQARPGDTERDLAAAIQSLALRSGAQTLCHTVCSAGVQSTVVHAYPLDKPIRPGEAIHVDFGARFDGYSTDLSRTAMVGEPNARQRDIHNVLWDAEQAMLARIKPGLVARELYDLNGEIMARHGLANPWGTIGHSTGLRVHEGFDITASCERVLEPGMILNIEPTHIEKGDARYHIEDSVVVTDTGIEILSTYYNSNEMFVIR